MQDFEKLGVFYLGKVFDLDKGQVQDELLLYDSKDLTTHALCVGMTGSGKTGLGITLLEEAAIDGIPALVIDPKGDMGNLLLTFPGLQSADFLPWVEPESAARAGLTVNEFASKTAETWQKGIAEWGQDATRIEKFKNSVDVAIYTPGSQTGLPLTILRSFDAPSATLAEDPEALRDRILSAVSGLLALLGITADPIRSRDHILISNILQQAWAEGRNLDI
jgi:DNA helicase HerA-like ATPase